MKNARILTVILLLLSFVEGAAYAQKIRTIAGNGLSANAGDGGNARNASFGFPFGITVDSAGNLFVVDQSHYVIRKINPQGIISTVAGTGYPGSLGDQGPATAAQISSSFLITYDAHGNLYFADAGNHKVRKIDTSGIITTIAGNGNTGFSGDNSPATNAAIGGVGGICFDNADNMYISDYNSRVRKIDTSGIITTLAGNGNINFFGNGGPATAASMDGPAGLAADTAGNIYIAEKGLQTSAISVIRKVNTSGIISTFAGNSMNQGFAGDGGQATIARLNAPNGMRFDNEGNLYFADQNNSRIRKIDAVTNIITTIAGTVGSGYSGDGGPATAAKLLFPTDICFGKHGKIYICDKGSIISSTQSAGHRIREIFYVDTFHISANPGTVLCGTALASFTAHLSDAYYSFTYQWYHNGVAAGTNSPNYAPSVLHNNDIITCSLIDTANGGMLLAVSDTINMIIQPPILPVVSLTSSGDTVCAGEPVTLTASCINGGTSPRYYWYLFGTLLDSGATFTYIPSFGDIITCVLVSSDPCAIPNTVHIAHPLFVIPSYRPVITIIANPGTTISYWGEVISMYSTVTYGGFAPIFQWYKNNVPIPGATSSFYAVDINFTDTFYCVMQSNAYCVVPPMDTSNYIYISTGTLGVRGINEGINKVGIYPNPNTGNFTLKGFVKNTPDGVMNIEVKNLLGQTVFRNTVSCANGKIDSPIKLNDDIPTGMYFLITTNGSGNNAIPFMVDR